MHRQELDDDVPIRRSQEADREHAIINCRGNKLCLSLYVNGGYGWYPGAVMVPGYSP